VRSDSDEVDVPSFDVRADEFHSHAISDVEARRAHHHSAFNRRLKEPDPRTSACRARHDSVEALPIRDSSTTAMRTSKEMGLSEVTEQE